MFYQPLNLGSAAKVRRDAINIAINKFQDFRHMLDLRPNEITGYGTQTYQALHEDQTLWFHDISCLIITDRVMPWSNSVLQLMEKWRELEEYAKDNAIVYEHEKKAPLPTPPTPTEPRTEDQDRFNVQNQNNRAAKMGAKGTFTYEEWMILRQHFGDVCGRCKTPMVRPVIDHVIPLSRSGTNYIENIQTLCKDCNSGKGARPMDYRDPDLMLSFLEKLEEFRKSS